MNDSPEAPRILLVAEGPSDRRRVPIVIEAVLGTVPHLEHFGGHDWLKIHDIPRLARERRLGRRFGFGAGDLGLLRQLAQLIIAERVPEGTAIIWVRDGDGRLERRSAAVHAAAAMPHGRQLCPGIPQECGEAWVIAGWTPATPDAKESHRALRRRLGFDPVAHPERLSHKDNVPKSAKAALKDLGLDDHDLEREALRRAASLDRERVEACGLGAFVDGLARIATPPDDQRN